MDYKKIFDDQLQAAQEAAELNGLDEVKVNITLAFEFTLKKAEAPSK